MVDLVRAALNIVGVPLIAATAIIGTVGAFAQSPQKMTEWTIPDVAALSDSASDQLIKKGRDLIVATPSLIGPNVGNPDRRYSGNNLSCSNCHLSAGTRKFGLPLFGLADLFPQYSSRTGGPISIEDRLNSCMTRSMNGRALPDDAPEMRALVAYVDFLSRNVAKGETLPGLGAGSMPELSRAADPARGQGVFQKVCAACHGTDGLGVRRNLQTSDFGYMVPPLWGNDSFNNGAGMARLSVAANFIHFNMPHGTDFTDPQLSVEDAWDVAAYMLSHPRPVKAGLEKDFPDLLSKPVDTAYGPYADGFSADQHRYGPFGPIRGAIAKLKQNAAPTSRR
ncbi:c-type cytochrome [Bosea sp. BH3]|uniref:c-type cytochrome n=1 Tax=Bosea sp. BH3 TaxID=2871701 RepID=UPI0021CAF646|nr:c-type cytochrome [Bosea sp. BH3]MCU4179697.1 c-type cytochrome [Bosea sp. BH3]